MSYLSSSTGNEIMNPTLTGTFITSSVTTEQFITNIALKKWLYLTCKATIRFQMSLRIRNFYGKSVLFGWYSWYT